VIDAFDAIPQYRHLAEAARIESVESESYYGKYYQDIQARVPAIHAVKSALDWEPHTDLPTAIRKTLEYHLERGDFAPAARVMQGIDQTARVVAAG
jgi:nucleoside-diphosphate-sugar epimerase